MLAYSSEHALTTRCWRWQIAPAGSLELLRRLIEETVEGPAILPIPTEDLEAVIAERRRFREVERLEPGFIRRALDTLLLGDVEPSREALNDAIAVRLEIAGGGQ
jgi:hypothetical protein